MNLSVGIVGLPNVGKSTLFNALLKKQVANVANYPFTTIEPNKGVVPVPDNRLPVLAKIVGTPKIVPAVVEFWDIAGLVKGAAEGEGLGNQFLAKIREVSLICQVVRFFEDNNVVHVANSLDPKRDVEIVNSELILADLQTLKKQTKPKKSLSKDEEIFYEAVEILKTEINGGKLAKEVKLTPKQRELIKPLFLLTDKQNIYVANIAEQQINKPELLNDFPFTPTIPLAAKMEAELVVLSDSEQKEYLKQYGLKEPGLDRLIKVAYESLDLISFLTTTGGKEVRAWTLRRGETALRASSVIHTDFAKNFIKVDVISYSDFVKFGGWVKCRELGKVRSEGAEYQIRNGEVVEFRVSC